MSMVPDTPRTLLNTLAIEGELDEVKWQQFDDLYRPVVIYFLRSKFPVLQNEAEDFAQETMIKLVDFLRNKKYNPKRAKFRTVLSAIVSHLAIDRLRRDERYKNLPFEDIDWLNPESMVPSARELLERQWNEACYAAARHRVLHQMSLPEHYAEIWRALERGERTADIAKKLGVTTAVVRQAKHRVSKMITAAAKL